MISINAIIFSNYMICEVYQSHPWRHGYPPSGLRIPGPGISCALFLSDFQNSRTVHCVVTQIVYKEVVISCVYKEGVTSCVYKEGVISCMFKEGVISSVGAADMKSLYQRSNIKMWKIDYISLQSWFFFEVVSVYWYNW